MDFKNLFRFELLSLITPEKVRILRRGASARPGKGRKAFSKFPTYIYIASRPGLLTLTAGQNPRKVSYVFKEQLIFIAQIHLRPLQILGMDLRPELAPFLQSNDVPSESTMLEVTESLKASFNELQEVETEIQRLAKLMELMKMKRQSIQKIINDHHIILSPARRLPPDVLHEIFFHCLPTHHNPSMKYSESPLLLTRICSSWRAIALSSPRIWSKIHIPLPGDPGVSEGFNETITVETRLNDRRQRFAGVMKSRCDAVRSWLSRSGTCPLSLSVAYWGGDVSMHDSKEDELIQEMFDILLSFADRWTNVILSVPEDIHNKLQNDINPTMFSSLQSLKITLYGKPHWGNGKPTPILLLAAPALRRLTINDIEATFHMTLNPVQPIWSQITHITFASATTDMHFLVLLRQCPNLVLGNFIVDASQWSEQTIVDQGEVLLPRLESLAINDSGTHGIMAILFHAIKAPALTKLLYQRFNRPRYIRSHSTGIPLPASSPVIPLLENSTLINDLSLNMLTSPDIEDCLQRGEQVTHIVFGRPSPTNTYGQTQLLPLPFMDPDIIRQDPFDLKILSIGSVEMILLPRLESLEAYNLSSLTDKDLLDMITSRIHASQRDEVAALKSVKIHFQRHRQKDITEDVSRLAQEAGIEVKLDLTYPTESPILLNRLSLSFGLTPNEGMWP